MIDENKQTMIKNCKESFLFFALGCVPFEFLASSSLFCDLDGNDKLIIEKARQVGMTTALALYVIWYAKFHDNKRVLYVSPNNGSNSFFKKRLVDCLNMLSFYKVSRLDTMYKNTSLVSINTTTIVCKTKGQFPLCSETFDLVIFEEADFFDDFEEAWRCVTFCLNKDAKIFIDSTLSYKNGLFSKMIESAKTKTGQFSDFTFSKIVLNNN